MSVFLLTSSVVTTLLIPHAAFVEGGPANGRALAYLAHEYLGNGFGTVYDVSHHPHPLVRRRLGDGRPAEHRAALPSSLRHGARTGRGPRVRSCSSLPAICFVVTLLFRARRRRPGRGLRDRRPDHHHLRLDRRHALLPAAGERHGPCSGSAIIALIFLYTTVVTVIEAPSGIKIAAFFIGAIVVVSLISRACALDRAAGATGRLRRNGRAVRAGGGAARHGTHHRQPPGRAEHARVRLERAGGAGGEPHPDGRPGPLPGGERSRRLGVRLPRSKSAARTSAASTSCGPTARRSRTRSPPSSSPSATAPARSRTPISAGWRGTR